jgi:hypothetical protein
MVVRMRKSGKSGLVAVMVTIALAGSALLAFALPSSAHGTYPSTSLKIKAEGTIGSPPSVTQFESEIQRSSGGSVQGEIEVQMPKGVAVSVRKDHGHGHGHGAEFHSHTIQGLTVSGNAASFTAPGSLSGRKGVFTANVNITDNPDTFAITITDANNVVVYSAAGPLTRGAIVFSTGGGHGHDHGGHH